MIRKAKYLLLLLAMLLVACNKKHKIESGEQSDSTLFYKIILLQNRTYERISSFDEIDHSFVLHVYEHSKAAERLENLRKERDAKFKIKHHSQEDDLAYMVAKREIKYAVIEDLYYQPNYYPTIDYTLALSIAYPLKDDTNFYRPTNEQVIENNENISPYDDLFKKYAPQIGWDWHLLAAVARVESNFKTDLVSKRGARGLMQLMPITATKLGGDSTLINEPEHNLIVAVKYIKKLQSYFNYIEDKEEQTRFVLASYNAGHGHVLDAVHLAQTYGLDDTSWADVERMLLLKSDEIFYNDPVCVAGRFRAKHTVSYIKKVYSYYEQYSYK